ncbi:MAG: hypothetical protein JWP27_2537 [Flaviaesturariibacter sp.]|nr:hypothetical protein [Flaviaesturariibacter sp.]
MKAFFLSLLLSVSLSFSAAAQDTLRGDAVLTAATVYLGYGGELVHQARLRVGADTRVVVLRGLSTSVDPNSLQISVPEGVALLSQQFRVAEKAPKEILPDVRRKPAEDSFAALKKEIARIDNRIGIESDMLQKTGSLIETMVAKPDKNLTGGDLLKLIETYTARIEKAKTNIFNLQARRTELEELVGSVQGRSQVTKAAPVAGYEGELVLQVLPSIAQDLPVSISYYTQRAGWSAVYDIRVNSKTNKVKMVYKASVAQTSGIDWKKAKLTLSTGTPSFGVEAPVLSPWLLQLYVPSVYNEMKDAAARSNLQRNTINSLKSPSLDEVVVTALQGKVPGLTASTTTIDPSTLGQFTTFNPGGLQNSYEIDLPYDIPADGTLRSVTIKSLEMDCRLKNYAVPRVTGEAFLLAEVANWQNLDLLPGAANIIMDETYVGKTAIDPNTTNDTLNLSLGRDRRIALNRVLVKEMSGAKASGASTRQTYTYELTVKNNKLSDASVLLKDQYPLSNVKEMDVKLEEGGGAAVNVETGVLTWMLTLKPGESRKVRFTYSITAPKDKKIVNPK